MLDQDKRKLSLMVERIVPTSTVQDYPEFTHFIKRWLEYLEQPGQPYHTTTNTIRNLNPFTCDESLLEDFRQMLCRDFPVKTFDHVLTDDDIRNLVANALVFNKTKGLDASIVYFFKALMNVDVTVGYPIIRKESDIRSSIRISTNGDLRELVGKQITTRNRTEDYGLISDDTITQIDDYGSVADNTEISIYNFNTLNTNDYEFNTNATVTEVDTVNGIAYLTNTSGEFFEGDEIFVLSDDKPSNYDHTVYFAQSSISTELSDNFTDFAGKPRWDIVSFDTVLAKTDHRRKYYYMVETEVDIEQYRDIIRKLLNPAGYTMYTIRTLPDASDLVEAPKFTCTEVNGINIEYVYYIDIDTDIDINLFVGREVRVEINDVDYGLMKNGLLYYDYETYTDYGTLDEDTLLTFEYLYNTADYGLLPDNSVDPDIDSGTMADTDTFEDYLSFSDLEQEAQDKITQERIDALAAADDFGLIADPDSGNFSYGNIGEDLVTIEDLIRSDVETLPASARLDFGQLNDGINYIHNYAELELDSLEDLGKMGIAPFDADDYGADLNGDDGTTDYGLMFKNDPTYLVNTKGTVAAIDASKNRLYLRDVQGQFGAGNQLVFDVLDTDSDQDKYDIENGYIFTQTRLLKDNRYDNL